jgi:hypothetical protein
LPGARTTIWSPTPAERGDAVAIRKAHGNGVDAIVRVETLPPDELPALNAQDTEQALASAARRGRPFTPGNRAAVGRKPALASSAGIPLDAKDPMYRRALGWARRYRKRRISELAIQHGGELSSGVCALITSSALDMAASRYLTAKAAAKGDTSLLKMASQLAQASRQTELTALEIASREADVRRKAAPPVDPMAAIRAQLGREHT